MSNPADKSKSGLSVITGSRVDPSTRVRSGLGPSGDTTRSKLTGAGANTSPKIDMKYLIHALIKYNASDLHIRVGRPPLYRINGKIVATKMQELSQEQAEQIIYGVLSDKQLTDLHEKRQVDLSFRIKDYGRFRCNVFFQRGSISAAIRMIPLNVPNIDELGVPAVLKELVLRPRGLILIVGSTGAGKSTTLASVMQYINETSHVHILAIEDPIEFVYRDMKATITQREVGSDTHSLNEGLLAGLRQDPDVMMIGEMRDYHMIQGALTAAETGHLVLSTLHTNDAKSTIGRIMDVFPAEAKNQVRIQLANSLLAVVAQQLVVRADGTGRVPACEVMVMSPSIREMILKNEFERVPEAIANSSNYYKMQTMNQSLEHLVKQKIITLDVALRSSNNPDDLKLRLSGIDREGGYEMAASAHQPPPAPPQAKVALDKGED
jgi:twitching motility protein PilT